MNKKDDFKNFPCIDCIYLPVCRNTVKKLSLDCQILDNYLFDKEKEMFDQQKINHAYFFLYGLFLSE